MASGTRVGAYRAAGLAAAKASLHVVQLELNDSSITRVTLTLTSWIKAPCSCSGRWDTGFGKTTGSCFSCGIALGSVRFRGKSKPRTGS